jgi:hypothetical protein
VPKVRYSRSTSDRSSTGFLKFNSVVVDGAFVDERPDESAAHLAVLVKKL